MTDILPHQTIAVQPASALERLENLGNTDTSNLGALATRVEMAAIFVMPTADLFMSDGAFGWFYDKYAGFLSRHMDKGGFAMDAAEKVAQYGGMGALITAEVVGLGLLVTRNKKITEAFGEYDEDLEERQKTMTTVGRAASKVAGLPISGVVKVAEKVEEVAEKVEKRKSPLVRWIGRQSVKAAHINVVGTNNKFLADTMNENTKTPDWKDMTRVGALFASTWLGLAEAIRYIYRGLHEEHVRPVGDPIRKAMAGFGQGYQHAVSVEIPNVFHTPVATSVLTAASICLGASGWNMAKFYEKKHAGSLDGKVARASEEADINQMQES